MRGWSSSGRDRAQLSLTQRHLPAADQALVASGRSFPGSRPFARSKRVRVRGGSMILERGRSEFDRLRAARSRTRPRLGGKRWWAFSTACSAVPFPIPRPFDGDSGRSVSPIRTRWSVPTGLIPSSAERLMYQTDPPTDWMCCRRAASRLVSRPHCRDRLHHRRPRVPVSRSS